MNQAHIQLAMYVCVCTYTKYTEHMYVCRTYDDYNYKTQA